MDFCCEDMKFLITIIVIEHFLLFMKIFLAYIIHDTPKWVVSYIEKEKSRTQIDKAR